MWPQPVFVQAGACIRPGRIRYVLVLLRHLSAHIDGLSQLVTARSDEARQKHKCMLLTPRMLPPNAMASELPVPPDFPAF